VILRVTNAPMRTRTSNLLIRSQVLYPIELWARHRGCPGQDSNLHAISGTGPSNQPVYQFQHLGMHCAKPFRTRSRLETAAQTNHRVTNMEDTARSQSRRAAVWRPPRRPFTVSLLPNARRGTRTLTRLLPQDPESCASANSAIRATPTLF
jgi:hypothetical protein